MLVTTVGLRSVGTRGQYPPKILQNWGTRGKTSADSGKIKQRVVLKLVYVWWYHKGGWYWERGKFDSYFSQFSGIWLILIEMIYSWLPSFIFKTRGLWDTITSLPIHLALQTIDVIRHFTSLHVFFEMVSVDISEIFDCINTCLL